MTSICDFIQRLFISAAPAPPFPDYKHCFVPPKFKWPRRVSNPARIDFGTKSWDEWMITEDHKSNSNRPLAQHVVV